MSLKDLLGMKSSSRLAFPITTVNAFSKSILWTILKR